MDHRCLYGHRVPATFAFAIQNRLCPMCGAATVTVTGYQVARKLTTDANLDAVQAFNVIKVIESEWVLQPANADARPATPSATPEVEDTSPAPTPAPPPVVSVQPPVVAMEEVVVEDEAAAEIEEVISLPEAKAIRPAAITMPAPTLQAVNASPVNITARTPKPAKSAFESTEEDFFKS